MTVGEQVTVKSQGSVQETHVLLLPPEHSMSSLRSLCEQERCHAETGLSLLVTVKGKSNATARKYILYNFYQKFSKHPPYVITVHSYPSSKRRHHLSAPDYKEHETETP